MIDSRANRRNARKSFDMTEEWFEIVDDADNVIGVAKRSECHGNPGLIHRTSHVVVLSSDGRLLLQKRSADKDIQPGKWDTAVGGHLQPGESYEAGAARELNEEIGLPAETPLDFLFDTRIRNDIESENVRVFRLVHDGPFQALQGEIDELRFWPVEELMDACGQNVFTPNLEHEINLLKKHNVLVGR